MTTKKLTPNVGDPVTGFVNPVLGWHFSAATALDVFEGAKIIQRAGWLWDIHPDPEDPTNQRMSVVNQEPRANAAPILVHNTDWFTLDSDVVRVLSDADVTASYTAAIYTIPAQQ